MAGSRVTRRYAKALFDLAREQNILDQIESDVIQLQKIMAESEEMVALLQSPVIQVSEKRNLVTKIFEDTVNRVTFDFLNLLLQKNREELLSEIISYFLKYLDDSKGILRGELLTAYELSASQKTALKNQLDRITGKDVLLQEKIDSSLIAGFVVRLDDTVIDSSIKNQLDKMREKLMLS
ncbi:MAG: F0F1 ATP synthase subunit delta [bacterium]|nr:MAG: F0F1 ATP synthase subunit delta [bacterium]